MSFQISAYKKINSVIWRRIRVAASLSLPFCIPSLANAADINEFIEYNYDHRNNSTPMDSADLKGRLFVPQQALDNPATKYPLVLFFHGDGKQGSNGEHVEANIDNLLANAKTLGFFIYAPQLAAGVRSWNIGTVDRAVRKLASATRDFNVDISRVYVTGLSLGGGAVWTVSSQYVGGVAATVSICSVRTATLDFARLVNRHAWAFHAANDTTVSVAHSRNRGNSIRAAEGLAPLTWPPVYTSGSYFYDFHNQRYTEYTTGGHAIWNRVFGNDDLYTWMLSKSLPLTTSSLLAGETMYFDLGGTRTVTDSSNNVWNSTLTTQYDTLEAMLPFCSTSAGRGTVVSLSTIQKFGGQSSGVSNATYGPGIGTDGWQTAGSGVGILSIQGLTPGASYSLKIFGSSTLNNRQTRYEVGDAVGIQTADLNATGNVSAKAEFPSLVADADGMIDISVRATPSSGSTIGVINAIELSR